MHNASRRNHATLLSLLAIAAGMAGLAYGAVPLYRIFCQVTGFGGTTQAAENIPSTISNRMVTVRFNTDIAPDLPWTFAAETKSVQTHIGEQMLVTFKAENLSDTPTRGIAAYNVTPPQFGPYFNKVQCFCFENQPLGPNEKAMMPVSFFIDPAMLDDPALKNADSVTLSYTFFKAKDEKVGNLVN